MQSYLHVFLQSMFIINGAFKFPRPYASIMVPVNNILEAGFWTVWEMDKWSLFSLDHLTFHMDLMPVWWFFLLFFLNYNYYSVFSVRKESKSSWGWYVLQLQGSVFQPEAGWAPGQLICLQTRTQHFLLVRQTCQALHYNDWPWILVQVVSCCNLTVTANTVVNPSNQICHRDSFRPEVKWLLSKKRFCFKRSSQTSSHWHSYLGCVNNSDR